MSERPTSCEVLFSRLKQGGADAQGEEVGALVRALTACEAEWEDLRLRVAEEWGSAAGATGGLRPGALVGQVIALLDRVASNVGELQSVIARALILSTDDRLTPEVPAAHPPASQAAPPTEAAAVLTETEMLELQRRNMIAALTRSGWVIYGKRGAARMLGVKPTTLIERMRRMGIRRPDREDTS